MVLAEGKNREIRRMLAKLGHKVMSLTRIAVGPIALKGLKPGQARPLAPREVELLRKVAAGEHVPVAEFVGGRSGRPAQPDSRGPRPSRPRSQEERPTTSRPPQPEAHDGRPPRPRAVEETRERAPRTGRRVPPAGRRVRERSRKRTNVLLDRARVPPAGRRVRERSKKRANALLNKARVPPEVRRVRKVKVKAVGPRIRLVPADRPRDRVPDQGKRAVDSIKAIKAVEDPLGRESTIG